MKASDMAGYRNHLIKSFSCISNNLTIKKNCPTIVYYSSKIRDFLTVNKSSNTWQLNIDPPWGIPILEDDRYFKKDEAFLLLSGILKVENSIFQEYTFISSIVLRSQNNGTITQIPLEEYAESKHVYKDRLIRRFHFDLASADEKDKPFSHLQFGGKENCIKYAYPLNHQIGIPRIPYPPIDFIIMFDLVLRQFKTKINSVFYDSKDWVSCVKKSESYRMKEYYDLIQKYFAFGNRKPLSSLYCEQCFFI